jgi:hypothetical protein
LKPVIVQPIGDLPDSQARRVEGPKPIQVFQLFRFKLLRFTGQFKDALSRCFLTYSSRHGNSPEVALCSTGIINAAHVVRHTRITLFPTKNDTACEIPVGKDWPTCQTLKDPRARRPLLEIR